MNYTYYETLDLLYFLHTYLFINQLKYTDNKIYVGTVR